MNTEGLIESASTIFTKTGTRAGKSYNFYVCYLTIDGVKYSALSKNKDGLVEALRGAEKGARISFTYTTNGDYNNIDLNKGVHVVVPLTSLAPATRPVAGPISQLPKDVSLLRECILDAERACEGLGFGKPEIQSFACTLFIQRVRK